MKIQGEILEAAKALKIALGLPIARGNVWAGIEDEQPVLIVEIEREALKSLRVNIPNSFSGIRVVVRDRFMPQAQEREAFCQLGLS